MMQYIKKINYVNSILPELFLDDYMINKDYINSRYYTSIVDDNVIEIEFYNHINLSNYKFTIDFNIEFTDQIEDETGNIFHYIQGKVINFYNPNY